MSTNLNDLRNRKDELLAEIIPLIQKHKEFYSNIDVSLPMSFEEKELNNNIAKIFSEINSIVYFMRKLKKGE